MLRGRRSGGVCGFSTLCRTAGKTHKKTQTCLSTLTHHDAQDTDAGKC